MNTSFDFYFSLFVNFKTMEVKILGISYRLNEDRSYSCIVHTEKEKLDGIYTYKWLKDNSIGKDTILVLSLGKTEIKQSTTFLPFTIHEFDDDQNPVCGFPGTPLEIVNTYLDPSATEPIFSYKVLQEYAKGKRMIKITNLIMRKDLVSGDETVELTPVVCEYTISLSHYKQINPNIGDIVYYDKEKKTIEPIISQDEVLVTKFLWRLDIDKKVTPILVLSDGRQIESTYGHVIKNSIHVGSRMLPNGSFKNGSLIKRDIMGDLRPFIDRANLINNKEFDYIGGILEDPVQFIRDSMYHDADSNIIDPDRIYEKDEIRLGNIKVSRIIWEVDDCLCFHPVVVLENSEQIRGLSYSRLVHSHCNTGAEVNVYKCGYVVLTKLSNIQLLPPNKNNEEYITFGGNLYLFKNEVKEYRNQEIFDSKEICYDSSAIISYINSYVNKI